MSTRAVTTRSLDARVIGFGLAACIMLFALLLPFPAFAQEEKGIVDQILGAGLEFVLSPVVFLAWAIFKFASFILGVAGVALNWAVFYLVFEFAKHLGNSPGMLLAWSILRDLGNVLLLFGFVWIGIRMILNVEHFSAGKALSQLVLFAVLLNFSLFVAEAIVDTSNALTLALYDQSNGATCGEGSDVSNADIVKECALNNGIAGQILSQVNIAGAVYAGNSADTEASFNAGSSSIEKIMTYLMLSIFVLTAAMVLAAGAILLVTRAITLSFLLVTSPIGFAGKVIPQLEEFADTWWDMLLKNAFFAPVFLLLILISLKLTDGMRSLAGDEGLMGALTSGGSLDAGPIFFFVLVIGFMIASLIAAQRFGAMGAGFAMKAAGNLTYGTMGFVSRRTFGAASNRLAQNLRNTRFGSSTLLGRTLVRGFDAGATNSFDGRSIPLVKDALKGQRLDFGSASKVAKEGRRGELKDAAKQASEFANTFEKARGARDKTFKEKQSELGRAADLSLAKAASLRVNYENEKRASEEAERNRVLASTPEEARRYERERNEHRANMDAHMRDISRLEAGAEKRDREAAKVGDDLKKAQVNRLSPEDQLLQKFYEDGGRGRSASSEATRRMEEAAEKIKLAMSEAAAHATKIADLEARRAGSPAALTAKIDEEIKATRALKEAAEAAASAAKSQQENASKLAKKAEEIIKKAKETGNKYTDSKFVLQQIARHLKTLSRSPAGLVLDPAKLRAAAGGIMSDASQSKEAKLAHELEHLLSHKEEHGDHGDEDHGHAASTKPAAPKGGGTHH